MWGARGEGAGCYSVYRVSLRAVLGSDSSLRPTSPHSQLTRGRGGGGDPGGGGSTQKAGV